MQLMCERGMIGGTVFVQTRGEKDRHHEDKSCSLNLTKGTDHGQLTKRPLALSENTRTGNKLLVGRDEWRLDIVIAGLQIS